MAKSKQGFASMTPERQREIARAGGIAAHVKGTGHEWNRTEAIAAGRKGGTASRGGRGRLTPKADVPPPTPIIADVDPDPELASETEQPRNADLDQQ